MVQALDSKERISCLNEKMARYIQRKFDTGLARDINGRINCKHHRGFTID
jgi:protein TonB